MEDNDKISKINCERCSESFYATNLIKHKKFCSKYGSFYKKFGDDCFKCLLCSAAFYLRIDLVKHFRINHEEIFKKSDNDVRRKIKTSEYQKTSKVLENIKNVPQNFTKVPQNFTKVPQSVTNLLQNNKVLKNKTKVIILKANTKIKCKKCSENFEAIQFVSHWKNCSFVRKPLKVFGAKKIFICKECKIKFKSKLHMNIHMNLAHNNQNLISESGKHEKIKQKKENVHTTTFVMDTESPPNTITNNSGFNDKTKDGNLLTENLKFDKEKNTFHSEPNPTEKVGKIKKERKSVCKYCKNEFTRLAMSRHVKFCSKYHEKITINLDINEFSCLKCKRDFDTKALLKTHLNTSHKKESKKKKFQEKEDISNIEIIEINDDKDINNEINEDKDEHSVKMKSQERRIVPIEINSIFKCQMCHGKYATYHGAEEHVEMFHNLTIEVQRTSMSRAMKELIVEEHF